MLLTTSRCWAIIRTKFSVISPRPYSCQANHRWRDSATVLLQHRFLSIPNNLLFKRRKDFFSSDATLRTPQRESEPAEQQRPEQYGQEQGKKRNSKRSPAGKTSLRRVAAEAQRSKDGHELKRLANLSSQTDTKVCKAIVHSAQS